LFDNNFGIAFQKPVTASSIFPGYPAENAVDGGTVSYYSAAYRYRLPTGEWFKIDLLEPTELSRVRVRWEYSPIVYTIQVSDDDINWTNVYTNTFPSAAGRTVDNNLVALNAVATGRYVRIFAAASNIGTYGPSIFELGIWGTPVNTTYAAEVTTNGLMSGLFIPSPKAFTDKPRAAENDVVTLSAVACKGQRFDHWETDLIGLDITNPDASFVMPGENVKIKAIFTTAWDVIINPSPNGTVTANPSTADPGETVILTVTPDSYYLLVSLTADESDVSITNNGGVWSFVMPDNEVNITPVFESYEDFLQKMAAGILKNGLSTANLVLEGKVLTLVIGDFSIVLSTNANNRNIEGKVYIGNGKYLEFDLKGNGSNIKIFRIVNG
jgi:hypothetical protein